ncbi:MAG: ABC transporter ATP-binding protein [Promethearchaeota archaeon]
MGLILSISNFSFKYSDASQEVLDNLNLDIFAGEIILISGKSGCGKSTLGYCIAGLVPGLIQGYWKGNINLYHEGKVISPFEERLPHYSTKVSYISQNPDDQFVSFDVKSEIAFGPENLRVPPAKIEQKVENISRELNIDHLLHKNADELSTGQKQLVSIAGQVIMGARILVLDEPTAYLDASNFKSLLQFLKTLNEKMGITIIIFDHDVQNLFPIISRIALLPKGGERFILSEKWDLQEHLIDASNDRVEIPWIMSLAGALKKTQEKTRNILASIQESIDYENIYLSHEDAKTLVELDAMKEELFPFKRVPAVVRDCSGDSILEKPLLQVKNLSYIYPGARKSSLVGINLEFRGGDVVGVIGNNGAGKTTLMYLLSGAVQGYEGIITYRGRNLKELDKNSYFKKIGFLFQNPESQIFKSSVVDELLYSIKNFGIQRPPDYTIQDYLDVIGIRRDEGGKNPFLLSWGQKRRLTISANIIHDPEIIIFDEPFIGHDAGVKSHLISMLDAFQKAGKLIIVSSHELDILSKICTKIVLLEAGQLRESSSLFTNLPGRFLTRRLHILRQLSQFRNREVH